MRLRQASVSHLDRDLCRMRIWHFPTGICLASRPRCVSDAHPIHVGLASLPRFVSDTHPIPICTEIHVGVTSNSHKFLSDSCPTCVRRKFARTRTPPPSVREVGATSHQIEWPPFVSSSLFLIHAIFTHHKAQSNLRLLRVHWAVASSWLTSCFVRV